MCVIGPTRLCPQGISVIMLDLDNTVVRDGVYVSPRVLDAIGLARERGVMACVSTGRARSMVPELLCQPQHMDYLICSNGAAVYDTFGGLMYECPMPRKQALAAIDRLEQFKPAWNTFIGGNAYFEWRCVSYMLTGKRRPISDSDVAELKDSLHTGAVLHLKKTAKRAKRAVRFTSRIMSRREGMRQVRSIRPYIQAADNGVHKMGCSLPSEKACVEALKILEDMGCFEIARVSLTELEITAKGASKGKTGRWLMGCIDIKPACAVAFGDSENDVPLSEACGTFVAMGNADPHVKELADDVCESIADDGVARWLERAMAEATGAKHV